MATPSNPVVMIPARLESTRLPRKPLADIAGEALIVHVWRRAREAALGPVYVACAEAEIADAVIAAGGEAVLTRSDHASGSDRIFEALERIDAAGAYDAVVNIQGDLPVLDAALPRAALSLLDGHAVDIGTVACPIVDDAARDDPGVVKPVVSAAPDAASGRALYFTRAAAPAGAGALHRHIGIYAYRRAALERFAALPPSPLERREGLEQLRALEAGMRIDVAFVDSAPLEVNTPADLIRARKLLGGGA